VLPAVLFGQQRRYNLSVTSSNVDPQFREKLLNFLRVWLNYEVKSPLSVVMGFADAILDGLDGPIDDQLRSDLDIIRSKAYEILDVLNRMLSAVQQEFHDSEQEFDTSSVSTLVDEIRRRSGSRIDWHFEAPNAEVLLHTDRAKVGLSLCLIGSAIGDEHGKPRPVHVSVAISSKVVVFELLADGRLEDSVMKEYQTIIELLQKSY